MVTIDLKPKDFKEVWSTLEDLAVLCYEEGQYKEGDELLALAMQFQKVAGYSDSDTMKRRIALSKDARSPVPFPCK